MFIKKYLLLSFIPLLLSGEPIAGKWKIDAEKTKQTISKLSIGDRAKQLLLLLSSAGYKSLECFENKICIFEVNDIDSCLGKFHWKKEGNDYLLTTYKDKLCKYAPSLIAGIDNPKVIITGNQLELLHEASPKNYSFFYQKLSSYQPQAIKNISLENIQYDVIYKSKAIDTYLAFSDSSLPTYFYLVFTDKDRYYGVGTTQNNITTIKEIKDIFKKKEEENKLSPKESLERLKNIPDNLAGIKNEISIRCLIKGSLTPNKNGISGLFNFYQKESDIHVIRGGFKSDAPRKCTQITFKSRNKLSCNNGVEYTLLDTVSAHQSKKSTLSKPTAHANENIVNIDIQAKNIEKKRKLEEEYLKAIQEMM